MNAANNIEALMKEAIVTKRNKTAVEETKLRCGMLWARVVDHFRRALLRFVGGPIEGSALR